MDSNEATVHTGLLDRVGTFLLWIGLLSILLGLGLDYVRAQKALSSEHGWPVPVEVLEEEPGRWALLKVSTAYFATRSWAVNPLSLIFWGLWALFAGWLIRQRHRVLENEMEGEVIARRRRLFRLFHRE